MRKAYLALFLLLLFGIAQAQVFEITAHAIEIDVDEMGDAEITEKFFLSFPNEYHLQAFREESENTGVDLVKWQELNPSFKPSLGSSNEMVVSDIGFVENDSRYLEIKYLLNGLMQKEKETSRMIEYSLNAKFFNNFIEGSFWVIPSNATILVDLPLQIEIQQPIKPEANIYGNRIVWTGYKSTNVMALKYIQWKQIASFNLNEIADMIEKSPAFPFIVAVVVILAIGLFLKRKTITAKIERYIIDHSSLSDVEEED